MKNNSAPKMAMARQNKFDQVLSKLAIFVSILMIVGGAIGMVLVQKDIKQSQDLRQQASVADGNVTVTMSSQGLVPDEAGKVDFFINTNGVQTDGVQLTFNVVTDVLDAPPVFTLLDSVPLQLAYSEVETTADGYLISVITLPKQLGQPFSSTTSLKFGSLDVTPNKEGSITLNFDVENSISTIHASNPAQDELTHIATTNFSVVDPAGSPSPSPSVSPNVSPSPSASPNVSPSPSISPNPSPSASPDASPAIGGSQVATCNESCSSNSDCDVNLRCYSGQCRLATNVSSATCSAPADKGLSFACNEYCSDSNECASGLTCYNNSCRNPENVSSATCADLTTSQRTASVQSCNESCSSNADCDVNLRCYQGACRLATNPGSFSCTASTKKVVSQSVYGSTTKTKGGKDASGSTATSSSTTVKTGPITTTTDKTDGKTNDKGSDSLVKDQNEGMENEDETAFDTVKNYFVSNPKLPITLMGIGLGLIVALLLLSLLKKRKHDDQEPPTPPMMGGTPQQSSTKPPTQYEQPLQEKINTLKQENMQPPKIASVPPAVKPPVVPQPPVVTSPNEIKVPENNPVKNNSGEVFSNQNKSSSMLEKLRNKDITPPKV
jgi:hypothetical protein